jgi:hypothetical protein
LLGKTLKKYSFDVFYFQDLHKRKNILFFNEIILYIIFKITPKPTLTLTTSFQLFNNFHSIFSQIKIKPIKIPINSLLFFSPSYINRTRYILTDVNMRQSTFLNCQRRKNFAIYADIFVVSLRHTRYSILRRPHSNSNCHLSLPHYQKDIYFCRRLWYLYRKTCERESEKCQPIVNQIVPFSESIAVVVGDFNQFGCSK